MARSGSDYALWNNTVAGMAADIKAGHGKALVAMLRELCRRVGLKDDDVIKSNDAAVLLEAFNKARKPNAGALSDADILAEMKRRGLTAKG